jgi:hypothetical protein
LAVGPTKRGQGTKITAIAAVTSLPLAVTVDSAWPHETRLVEETLAGSFLDVLPARLIGDRAYDSDPLDRRLERDYSIELIRPIGRTAARPRTGASCDATSDVGASSGYLPGCNGSGDWSRATNITSRTFSAWSASAA